MTRIPSAAKRCRRPLATLFAISLVLVAASCGGNDAETDRAASGGTASTEVAKAPARYDELGPHAVGVTTLSIPTDAGGTRDVLVWYPADAAASKAATPEVFKISDLLPPKFRALVPENLNPGLTLRAARDIPGDRTSGSFPIFVYSHGFGGYPSEYQHLLTHVASWGFVVVSPVHDERGLLSLLGEPRGIGVDEGKVLTDAATAARAANAEPSSPLQGIVKTDGKYVVGGHSAGTRSALEAANESAEVDGIVQMSGGGSFKDAAVSPRPVVPALFLTGSTDKVVPLADVTAAFESYNDPKMLVSFENAGHLSFTDICTIGRDQGGVLTIANKIGLTALLGDQGASQLQRLAGDGCAPEWITPEQTWPAQEHLTVAFLRWRAGIDSSPAALTAAALTGVGEAKLTFTGSLG